MSEKTANLELTEAEATTIIQLFDAALKATGLQFASKAVQLIEKLQRAFVPAPTPPLS